MYKMCMTIASVLLLPSISSADNEIVVWESTGTYTVDPDTWTVLITSPGTFKIKATGDDSACQYLGYITSITVAQGVDGPVNLYIAPEENDPTDYGACDVGWIDLSNATAGSVKELRIFYYLGQADGNPGQNTVITDIDGVFLVGKSVTKDVSVATLASGCFMPTALEANLYVTGEGPHYGDIEIATFNDGTKSIQINGSMLGAIHLGST